MHLAVALDLHLQPLADGVDGGDADAVETGRDLVRVVVELAARVQHRHHDLGRADALGVHADRDAAAVVLDGDRVVGVDDDGDGVAVAREVLVDRVVDRLPHEVVQAGAVVHVADVHAGALAHRLEALEHLDGALAIGLGLGGVLFVRFHGP